jgi:glutamyl-tRNA reductase
LIKQRAMIEQITRIAEENQMRDIAPEVVSIADACLGGLYGRSALLVGSEEYRLLYAQLLQRAGMKTVYQENTPFRVPALLSRVQLFIHMPNFMVRGGESNVPLVTAAMVAKGCERRHTPLLIFDLASTPSVEELAGLLPAVCLYTPTDLSRILIKAG